MKVLLCFAGGLSINIRGASKQELQIRIAPYMHYLEGQKRKTSYDN